MWPTLTTGISRGFNLREAIVRAAALGLQFLRNCLRNSSALPLPCHPESG